MNFQVNKKYIDRIGNVWTIGRIGHTVMRGVDCQQIDCGNMWYLDGKCFSNGLPHDNDLISEYNESNELIWCFSPRNKSGIWAYGGSDSRKRPILMSVSHHTKVTDQVAWRCYLGSIPEITVNKKHVMWLCNTVTSCPNQWLEEWVEEGKFPEGFRHDKSDMERFIKTERVK